MVKIRRGDVFFAELDPVVGSEQGGVRPVLIIQNDVGNQYSPTTIIAAITGQMCKAKLPTHVDLAGGEHGLSKNSVVLVEQVRTIDKQRLKERICTLDKTIMEQVNQALQISMGLSSLFREEEHHGNE
jgi:mRNA interferase MazF